ncbi:MAG: hypothetical protein AB9834_19275 [Lentimicrobium sp.]
MDHIGKKMKMFSEQSTLTIGEIAQRMETTYQNLYKMFGKESIDSRHLINLSKILEIPVSQFFEEESRDELSKEIKSLRGQLQSKDEIIAQLQKQNSILNKLVKANEIIIQKQETINDLVKLYGVEPVNSLDPSDPSFEKLYKLAMASKTSTFFELYLQMESDPELKRSYLELLANQNK